MKDTNTANRQEESSLEDTDEFLDLLGEHAAREEHTKQRRLWVVVAVGLAYTLLCGWLAGPWLTLLLVGAPLLIVGLVFWFRRTSGLGVVPRRLAGPMVIIGVLMLAFGSYLALRPGGPPAYANPDPDAPAILPNATPAAPVPPPAPPPPPPPSPEPPPVEEPAEEPVDEAPAQEEPAGDLAPEQAPVEDPVEQQPVEPPANDPPPVQDPPPAQPPVENPPVEPPPPVEQPPVDEPPAEEPPLDPGPENPQPPGDEPLPQEPPGEESGAPVPGDEQPPGAEGPGTPDVQPFGR